MKEPKVKKGFVLSAEDFREIDESMDVSGNGKSISIVNVNFNFNFNINYSGISHSSSSAELGESNGNNFILSCTWIDRNYNGIVDTGDWLLVSYDFNGDKVVDRTEKVVVEF